MHVATYTFGDPFAGRPRWYLRNLVVRKREWLEKLLVMWVVEIGTINIGLAPRIIAFVDKVFNVYLAMRCE